mmetsp:Transcript_31287/g.42363  ORF Transcript_31287/g.42363 Transcript_31287/m.42363 type:complete len:144 (-) Transcript_31287:1124-1555(-)
MVKGEITIFRGYEGSKDLEILNVSRTNGYWNERVLVFDSPADCSVRAEEFVESYAFDGSKMRSILCKFPNVHQRTRSSILKKLWRMSLSHHNLSNFLKKIRLQNAIKSGESVIAERDVTDRTMQFEAVSDESGPNSATECETC